MIEFSDNLYISDKLQKKSEHLKNKLRAGDADNHFYVVYKDEELNQYEYMHSVFFRNKYLQVRHLLVYGLTVSTDEATKLVARLYSEANGYIFDTEDN